MLFIFVLGLCLLNHYLFQQSLPDPNCKSHLTSQLLRDIDHPRPQKLEEAKHSRMGEAIRGSCLFNIQIQGYIYSTVKAGQLGIPYLYLFRVSRQFQVPPIYVSIYIYIYLTMM